MLIIIVEPVQSSGSALIAVAVEEGLEVIIITSVLPQKSDIRIKATIQTDTLNVDAICHAIQNISIDNIKAVIPGNEQVVRSSAEVAQRLGLKAIQPNTQRWVRNKFAMRDRLSSSGFEVPRYAHINGIDELKIASEIVGFPAVLKPIDGSGSVCVKKVNNYKDLFATYSLFQNFPQIRNGRVLGKRLILESYLSGVEYSVEGYIQNKQAIIISITDKILGAEPWFVEMGHIVEADLTSVEKTVIEQYIQQIVNHFQLDFGVFHAELRLTEKGPVLIEIAARLSGNYICHLVEKSKNFSLPKAMLLAYLGREHEITFKPPSQSIYSGIRFFTKKRSKILKERLSNYDGVEEVTWYDNNRVNSSDNFQDSRCYTGHVIFSLSTQKCYKTYLDEMKQIF